MIRRDIKFGENVMIGLFLVTFGILGVIFCMFFFKKVVLSDD